MFNQQKKSELKVGDYVVVGSCINEKFVKAECVDPKATIRVESIVEEGGAAGAAAIKINLLWSGGARSYVYLHDKDKYWKRIENYN